ncbi:MAG: glycosyltransferase family 4 protein [Acidobacteriota bacterium]
MIPSPAAVPIMLMVRELGPGGTERQLTELARHLDRSRFIVHVGCFNPGIRQADLEGAGIPVQRFPVTSFVNASTVRGAWELGNYLRRHDIRILHTFDAPLNVFGAPVGKALSLLTGRPKVLTSQRGHRSLTPDVRKGLRVTDRIADAIVVNCEYLREHLTTEEDVLPGKIRLCYNGLDTALFYPDRQAGGPFTIGVTCVLRAEKGLATLVRGFAAVRHLRPEMRLCIVGDGAMLGELQRLASQLGVAQDTHFEPATSNVRAWLNQMDVFVLPSLDEAFSNSLMEAMACGCAAVASNVGGNPELVREGETGLLFEKENVDHLAVQLRSLIENQELLDRLAAAGVRRISNELSVEKSTRRMEEIYRQVLG